MEVDDVLLSAVREGNVDLLESYLTTLDDPDLYLNRVYEEADEQKCTLLMIACLHGHEDVVRLLLDRFKPNLEIANDIRLDEISSTKQMYQDVSVLWAAAATGNFPLIKLLLEHGANVNYRTKTRSTPLRCLCRHGNVEKIRYLIEHGADVHAANDKNETILMVSANYNHLDVVTYLIDQYHCDVNATDDDGRSPLYDAVYCQSLAIGEFLLKRGARNFRAIVDQMSPLMWAAEKRLANLVDAISRHCPILEQIEAKELLGSAYIYAPNSNHDFKQAFQCFSQAIQLRLVHYLPKALRTTSLEIFDYRQECQTLEDLEIIQSSSISMFTEGLLIRERLLGLADARYRSSVTYHGAFLADSGQYHRALMLWMYELHLCQLYSIILDPTQLREIVSLISEMLFQSMMIPVDSLLRLLVLISEELERNKNEFDRNLCTLLFLITIIAQFLNQFIISDTDHRTFYHQLYIINQRRYTTSDYGRSLLHLSLDDQTPVGDYHISNICSYPCFQTTSLLLQCDADVNAVDVTGNTPLHVFISNDPFVCDESILKLLCDAGAHLDYVNIQRQTPFDLAATPMIRQLLKIRMHLNLKCSCARLIQKENVSFHGKLSTTLAHFVEKH